MMCYIFLTLMQKLCICFKCQYFLKLASCLHLYLQLEGWVVSHVNQQAVEGSQTLGVSLTAATPWMGVIYKQIYFYTYITLLYVYIHTYNISIQTERHKGTYPAVRDAVMYVPFRIQDKT